MKKNELFKYLFPLIVTFLLQFAFNACSCKTCGMSDSEIEIPDSIRITAAEFIKSKTGDEFYSDYISFDAEASKRAVDGYLIYFTMRDLERDFIDERIYFFMNNDGIVLENYSIYGIPDCISDETKCTFNLDENSVMEIAELNNLSKGIDEWDLNFEWSEEFDMYLWTVNSILVADGKIGEEMLIDPSDGKIIAHREWKIK
ncbi:MAG: hypothetical protein K9G63_01595 [Melioribacteraceae bacterium]|nr:hypothetical protein [Melioribacteraceae bacterium]